MSVTMVSWPQSLIVGSGVNGVSLQMSKRGVYKSKSWFGLMYERVKHRTYHLINDGKWMD